MWTFQIRTFPLSKPTSSYHSPNQYFLTRATKNHYDNFVDLLKVYHSQIFYATLILDVHYSSSSNLRIKILSGLSIRFALFGNVFSGKSVSQDLLPHQIILGINASPLNPDCFNSFQFHLLAFRT